TYNGDTAFTTISSWVNSIHTVDEYSQLVTPQAVYTLHALLQNDVTGSLNGFVVFPGTSWDVFFRALQLFGVRYYVADPAGALMAHRAGYPLRTMPRRPLVGEPGLWQIYELPDPNVGNYSPTEVMTATSAPEMVAAMRAERFDFRRQVVLPAAPSEPLVPADDVRLSLIRGGFHLSGHSSGTSLVILPLQFSNCLRARDERIRLMRADLLITFLIYRLATHERWHRAKPRQPLHQMPAGPPRLHVAGADESRFGHASLFRLSPIPGVDKDRCETGSGLECHQIAAGCPMGCRMLI